MGTQANDRDQAVHVLSLPSELGAQREQMDRREGTCPQGVSPSASLPDPEPGEQDPPSLMIPP